MSMAETAPKAESLTLDEPAMGVHADDPEAFLALAENGLIGAAGRGCNAVQDALRADTRVSLGTTAA